MRNLVFSGNFQGENVTLAQIQKRTAKKLFENGETIYLQSCNFRPFGCWSQAIDINKERAENDIFEDIVNSFEYYNCANSETGLYTTFYKKIK